ncbi:MAG TPA: flavodoxin family protein [Syntrophales bacterium]|nr:flavodoxin family protein [Syntrophales bacterium]HOX93905.1 flavodoxin family protein [Syntrophales bacterium]HPI57986.1 flavodoxin family protein [Syntrophales bacterium]HPN25886.1 flavodoxin family protein [Syntrophales bacterium]HQM29558.1 flavodoxin family protein [Syntrophales bacterium]
MRALVTYFTRTGNTEKVARAIFNAVEVEKEILPLDEVKTVQGYDIVFIGFPVIRNAVPIEVQPFIKGLPAGEKVAFFSTHGSLRGGLLSRQAFEDAISLAIGKKVLGHFGCRGRVSPEVIDALEKQPETKAWAEVARTADPHPDAADLKDAVEFARAMIAKAR